jgi:pyruvate/2-oxoglutarate dehydrogenase complex dihydrolipoamide dehydrogenase (E3) component
VKHIYAAGDVVGGPQFTHFAGWQAFQAVRNALLPGHNSGFTELLPWVTYTDPEVAHVGLTETDARERLGGDCEVHFWPMKKVDRAVCENDVNGFIKIVTNRNGAIVGATIVASRAGETITEIVIAMKHGMRLKDLAGVIHAYPTYSTAIQQIAAKDTIERLLTGTQGRIIRGVSRIVR